MNFMDWYSNIKNDTKLLQTKLPSMLLALHKETFVFIVGYLYNGIIIVSHVTCNFRRQVS